GSGTPPPDVAALIGDVVAQVPAIRELEPKRDVPYEMITREQFRTQLEQLLAEEVDPEQLAAEERLLKRLGLLPDDTDLAELLLELYGAQVAAFYEPENGRFYIIERDEDFSAMDRMIVAHEYTHALQDQHFDLEGTRVTDPSQGDAALAQQAVVEGDATLVMSYWAQENLSFDELLELLEESLAPAEQETLEGMPPILSRQLLFPYSEGAMFVGTIEQEQGWQPINDLLQRPPASTEQILHPEKYATAEAPVQVQIPDVSKALGTGWQRSYEQTFGELNTQIWLAADEELPNQVPGMPAKYPFAEEAEGWGGDRLHMYEAADGGWAVVWELAWDSQEDADEFRARALELQARLDGVSDIDAVCDGNNDCLADSIRLLIASDDATLERLKDGLGR
ncbi:MAG TPA: hypothetical protein VK992_01515, partial [Candidatus Caenarcaniphilales bacterium]|nr:hypothetical protein [Candidatus Caenarcaniphilales bacterium]